MSVAALLQAVTHAGDSQRMEHAYFWSGVALALVPVLIFGTIGVLVVRAYRRRAPSPSPKEPPPDPR